VSFRENMVHDFEEVISNPEEYARPIEYFFDDSTSETFDAPLFFDETERDNYTGQGRQEASTAEVAVPYSIVPTPSLDHWVVFEGEKWFVVSIDDEDRIAASRLRLRRRTIRERSGEEFRRTG